MHTLLMLAITALAASPGPGATLAIEDTMSSSVPEVLVRAPRVTLDEILDRVAQGEARRDSLILDQSFTFTMRVVGNLGTGKEPRLLFENVRRVYRKRPALVHTVMLRDYRYKEKKREAVRAEFSSNMSEEIVNFAFRAEARRDYRYTITNRSLAGGHVIYEISFEPRSRLAFDQPRGRVWIDTNEFVIVREELDFDRSPAPLILKDIDRMVIERARIQGHWVLERVLIRMRMTIPMPTVGRLFDLTLLYDDYALNQGIDDSVFEDAQRAEGR